jgi:hypothetical protein
VGSTPTQGMDIWFVYVFILCLCCDELITRPRGPAVCKNEYETEKEARAHEGCRASKKI